MGDNESTGIISGTRSSWDSHNETWSSFPARPRGIRSSYDYWDLFVYFTQISLYWDLSSTTFMKMISAKLKQNNNYDYVHILYGLLGSANRNELSPASLELTKMLKAYPVYDVNEKNRKKTKKQNPFLSFSSSPFPFLPFLPFLSLPLLSVLIPSLPTFTLFSRRLSYLPLRTTVATQRFSNALVSHTVSHRFRSTDANCLSE